ncbi:MAG: hypothetical protein RL479_2698 [Verrucomicrobiota bacterium]|jgi:hypothetical protein
MKRHYAQTKAQRQAEWLAQFNDLLTARVPALSGRIEWPAALHYFHAGVTPADAVDQYCVARNITKEA